ncbi:BQ2448_2677 [Microbotryum intermedium]|uniref:BQ2448_2677 protein n=1 Tax=Microbotryum intermedium TaxID=269621 RepID=A0A238FE66_9BASI|nr:BQ2448_2677 [Microbotryum intermedium]
MSTRAAPSEQAVPVIARFVPTRFAQRSSLRPAVMLIAFFGSVYALFATASLARRRHDQDTSSKLNAMYLALIVLYALTAVIEAFGVAAVYRSSIALVKAYFLASVAVAFIVTGAECTRLALLFIDKSAIISACFQGETASDPTATLDAVDIDVYCRALWNRNVYWDIGLLIFSLLLSVLFASIVASYLQQLLNPALTRQHQIQVHNFAAGSSQYNHPGAYPLGAYPPNPYGQPPPSAPPLYQPGYVPAYEPNGFVVHSEGEKSGQPDGAPNLFSDRHPHSNLTTEQREQMQHDQQQIEAESNTSNQINERTETVTLEPRRGNEGRV